MNLLQTNTGVVYYMVTTAGTSFDQYTTFSQLFDQYRIDMVQVTIRPQCTANPPDGTSVYIPQIVSVTDFDDNNTPGSIAAMRDYESAVSTIFETQVRTYKPNARVGSDFPMPSPWIDMAQGSVAHYGCKIAIEPGLGGQTAFQRVVVNIRAMITFQFVR